MLRFLLAFLITTTASAQLQLVPLVKPAKKTTTTSRTQAVELALPFWDDFSFAKESVPVESLWLDGNSVWVNDGMAIDPPSINIATFDGLDATGKPYNVNDVLAKGYADKLESQVIRIDEVPEPERNSVYLSFYYQMKGRGETPDLGDLLILQFKTDDGSWERVWSAENNNNLSTNVFNQAIVPIVEERFYHNAFQFRIQNYARLSGPYDTWHVDYVYLNKGRNQFDLNFPDRTVASSLGSMFGEYYSIPKQHFFLDNKPVVEPSFSLYNLQLLPQPLNYFSSATITTYKGDSEEVMTATLDTEDPFDAAIPPGEHRTETAEFTGLADLLSEDADSIKVSLKLGLYTRDNVLLSDGGDYNEANYSPIDFRHNDTLRANFWISSYYAYDDGFAEYGAGLSQPGAQVAYEFNLMGVDTATISAVDMYFPRFGDETSQVIELKIWKNLTDKPSDLIYREVVTLQRSSQNKFWRKKLLEAKLVPSKFYVGWKQSSASVIAIGLDKNTDTGSRMFYNTVGTWEQNTQVAGSFMMRPVVGKGNGGVDTGWSIEKRFAAYPNPTNGTFFFHGQAEEIAINDIMGRPAAFQKTDLGNQTQIDLTGGTAGIYIVRIRQNGQLKTSKVVVRK